MKILKQISIIILQDGNEKDNEKKETRYCT
jgi:hypothetical protein